MCGGLTYPTVDPVTGEVKLRKAFFPIPKVKIPVIEEGQPALRFCQWGRRQGEETIMDVPITGWARLQSLKDGLWSRYKPRRVLIPALRWMEKDAEKESHWFDMDPEHAILGVLIEPPKVHAPEAEPQDEAFVYVVTRPADGEFAVVHQRMPLITSAKNHPLVAAMHATQPAGASVMQARLF